MRVCLSKPHLVYMLFVVYLVTSNYPAARIRFRWNNARSISSPVV